MSVILSLASLANEAQRRRYATYKLQFVQRSFDLLLDQNGFSLVEVHNVNERINDDEKVG